MDVQNVEASYVPWYRQSTERQPYVLSTILTFEDTQLRRTACFPWTADSLESLWDGHATQEPPLASQWKNVAQKWMGAIAVAATGRLIVFPKLATAKPIVVRLSEPGLQIDNVAWAISSNRPLEPLIVFTVSSVILILDVNSCAIVGKLRGHGGLITSLCVHPTQPHLFCTTSRDFTARIYDLSLYPVQVPNNPHWLPRTEPSRAGPPHGLHMCEPEGEGIGQCVAVLVGGRSGGHKAAVLCCAFHPSLPLIATGGIDRAVKIWRIPPSVFSPPAQPRIAREDKPLFSTDLIHKAMVLSVYWLADSILVSRSAAALMRRNPDVVEDTYYEQGTVVVWQWLGLNRFFPPGMVPQKIMRGTASDYRNSESFKILSAYHLPMVTEHFHVYRSPHHDPILLIPVGKVIRIFNVSQFGPRKPPTFPADDLVLLTDQMHITESASLTRNDQEVGPSGSGKKAAVESEAEGPGVEDNGNEEPLQAQSDEKRPLVYPPPAPLAILFDAVPCWDVRVTEQSGGSAALPDVASCEVGFEGRVIVGVGGGALYIWRLEE
ncbi:WD40 repeat-like protein [Trametes sanguinea]|nr:WD40 repeat-like protein [Trametes sanguinea]